jgi:hypothetical protein
MTLLGTNIDLLALADEMAVKSSRLVGQVLQVTLNDKGGWGILLARNPESRRYYFQGRDCPAELPEKGALVSFEPSENAKGRSQARELQVLAIPEARK